MKLVAWLDNDRLVISNDNGRTVTIPAGERFESVVTALSNAFNSEDSHTSTYSAFTLSSCAEAPKAKPSDTEGPANLHQRSFPETARIALQRNVDRPSQQFQKLLENRQSIRAHGIVKFGDISQILIRSARVKSFGSFVSGVQTTQRPVPSAGGRHPHELLLVANRVEGLKKGIWKFDAFRGELIRQEVPTGLFDKVLESTRDAANLENSPSAVLLVLTNFARTLSRYPTGTSLVWRDCGALLMTLHLVAEDLELGSCILGTCGLIGKDLDPDFIDTGALLLGEIV